MSASFLSYSLEFVKFFCPLFKLERVWKHVQCLRGATGVLLSVSAWQSRIYIFCSAEIFISKYHHNMNYSAGASIVDEWSSSDSNVTFLQPATTNTNVRSLLRSKLPSLEMNFLFLDLDLLKFML